MLWGEGLVEEEEEEEEDKKGGRCWVSYLS